MIFRGDFYWLVLLFFLISDYFLRHYLVFLTLFVFFLKVKKHRTFRIGAFSFRNQFFRFGTSFLVSERVSSFLMRVSSFLMRVFSFLMRVSSFLMRVSSFLMRVFLFLTLVSSFLTLVSSFLMRVSSFLMLVFSFRSQFLRF